MRLLGIIPLLFCSLSAIAQDALSARERMLLERVEQLEQQMLQMQKQLAALQPPNMAAAPQTTTAAAAASPTTEAEPAPAQPLPAGTTVNVNVDGYYGYNFNQPFTQTNALRAYDVSGNSFAINQAGIVIERAPDVAAGRRFGARLDLMAGQATETLQGSPANERRPEVYRHLFQAYGTYVAPVGKGLTVDFGKWASSFGLEGNYTKDQLNYSRAYWFNYLPFYHMGVRSTYALNDKVKVSYWLTNGLNQTEDFNGFKSHAVLVNFTPAPSVSANINYFTGQEQRSVDGVTPRGRSHFFDGYITWDVNERWTVAAEADYVVDRVSPNASPDLVYGGAGYARYRFSPRWNLAGRFVYLRDKDGLFSGRDQALKDTTATLTYQVADGFQLRWEARRDHSDVPFFPGSEPGIFKRQQTTALMGLVWWFGGKEGSW